MKNVKPLRRLKINQPDILKYEFDTSDPYWKGFITAEPFQLIIRNCDFEVDFTGKGEQYPHKIFVFENCSFLNTVNFNRLHGVHFKECSFSLDVNIESKYTELEFIDCQFTHSLQVNANVQNLFVADRCNIGKNFHISGNLNQGLNLFNINCGDRLTLSKMEILGDLQIQNIESSFVSLDLGVNITGNATIFHAKTNGIELDELTVTRQTHLGAINSGTLRLMGIHSPWLSLEDIKIEHRVDFFIDTIKNCLIEKIQSKDFTIKGVIGKESFIKFSDSNFETLEIIEVKNNGILEFNRLTIQQQWKLLVSDLRKTDFINCSFHTSSWLFENSKIIDIFMVGSSLPNEVVNQHGKRDNIQARLAYGQLHKAMLSMGDNVSALEYQSLEIKAHYREIEWLSRKWLTKFNLFLNYISNDFGRSWGRGLVFSLLVSIAFFWGLVISTDEFTISLPITFDFSLIASFFRFINPLRFFETEKIFESAGNLQLSWISYIIDFTARVLIAYGFYQTIQAFRRMGKS